jgi:hypothetical protein
MTPKEKAIELVERYDDALTYLESKAKAKQCALIAVDELIDQCWSYREIDLGLALEYWQEVKQEIEKHEL